MKPYLRTLTFLLVFLLFLALYGCNAIGRATPQALPTVVLDTGTSAPAGTDSTSSQSSGGVIASGVVAPAEQAEMVFASGGMVNAVNVSRGDNVKAGDVLVTLA